MEEETRETPTALPSESSKKIPKPNETVAPAPKPDPLLDKLQSEAARTIGAGQSGQSGSSHS